MLGRRDPAFATRLHFFQSGFNSTMFGAVPTSRALGVTPPHAHLAKLSPNAV